MAFVEMAGGWLAGKFMEMALEAGAKGLVARLKDKAARNLRQKPNEKG